MCFANRSVYGVGGFIEELSPRISQTKKVKSVRIHIIPLGMNVPLRMYFVPKRISNTASSILARLDGNIFKPTRISGRAEIEDAIMDALLLALI